MSATPSLYVDRDTPIHRLNARAKFALAFGLFVAAYVFAHPLFVAVPLGVGLLGLIYVGGLRNLLRLGYIVVALFLVGFVVWPAFTPAGGPVIVDTALVRLTEREFLFALGRSERIAAFIIVGLGFVTTTSNEELVEGLRAVGLPYAFCFAIGTALRLFPTFLGAAGTVRQAQEARGLDLSSGNPIQRLRNYIPLLIPVFMTAFRNVQTQSMALEARGFDTRRERTFYGRRTFQTYDWIATVFGLAIAVGSIGLSLSGIGGL